MSETPYLDALLLCLPTELGSPLFHLPTSGTNALESLVRFTSGGPCPPFASATTRATWPDQQKSARTALDALSQKRKRSEDDPGGSGASETSSKRPKLADVDDSDMPRFTLHAISAAAPVRKKVDITISANAITLAQPASTTTHARVPISSIARAFLLPTRGKQKPHWTVLLLPASPSSSDADDTQGQIIFSVDAQSTTPFTTTTFSPSSSATTSPKGTTTLPHIRAFLSHLPDAVPVLEPDTAVFRGASGDAGVDAYRAAKPGSLWFLRSGILWGTGRPCEFWALSELESVRVISATGRTCSVYLTRRSHPIEGGEEEEEEGGGVETEFGGVDGKEMEGIREWVRVHQKLFGKEDAGRKVELANGAAPAPEGGAQDNSDPEDEDFSVDSEDEDGGSATSSSSSDGGGSDAGDAQDSDEAQQSGDDAEEDDDDEEEELNAARHPLLRPGMPMPRLSRAAVNAVVGMVEDELMGGGEDEEEGEEDELED